MQMKILMLDIDGVLNNVSVFKDRRFGPFPLDHLCIERLHTVVQATDCQIVLSSSWRGVPDLERKLEADFVFESYFGEWPYAERINVRHKDGRTKRYGDDESLSTIEYEGRGSEIAEWLSRHPEVTRYAIVDDDSDMLPEQMPFFVQTSFETGMTDEHAAKLIEILNG
jgi:hypothetical protein